MKMLKFLINVALSVFLIAGMAMVSIAGETEVNGAIEVQTEKAAKDETKAITAENIEGTEETPTSEASEVAESTEVTEDTEKAGKKVAGETASDEATGMKESIEGKKTGEETATEEGEKAKEETLSTEGTMVTEKEEVKEGEEVTEKVEERQPRSLEEELKIMAIGVDGIVARLGKMQESADKKEKKELPSDLADLEDKIVSLRSQSDMVHKLNEEYIEKGKAHFVAWGQELARLRNESLRRKGEKRREKQSETFKDFQDTMADLDKTSDSFKSNAQEITDYLKYDLRPESVNEISGDINKIKRMGKDITELIEGAMKDLKSLPVFGQVD